MPVGVCLLTGPEYRYTFANERYHEFFGGDRGLIGKPLIEALPELKDSKIPSILSQVYRSGEPFRAEEYPVELVQIDGSVRTVFFNFSYDPVRNDDGSMHAILVTAVDVTSLVDERLKAQKALTDHAELQKQLKAALRTSQIGFWDYNPVSGLLTLTPEIEKDWGIAPDTFDGQLATATAMIHPEDLPTVESAIAASLNIPGTPYAEIYRVVRPDGKIVHIEALGEATHDEDGRVTRFFGTSRDITEQVESHRQAVQSAAEFEMLAELTPQMLFVADQAGNILYYNKQFYSYTGMTFEQLRDWGWKPIIHPDDLERTIARWQRSLSSGEPYECEYRVLRHDGVYQWLLGRALPLRDQDGRITRWLGTNTDIHSHKSTELELLRAKAAAEDANATKSAFLANMSHEIRTPLGAIIGFAEFLKKGAASEKERAESIDAILRNSNHLLSLVNDILDLSKVESGKTGIDVQSVGFCDVLNEVVSMLRAKAEEKSLSFELGNDGDVPRQITTDPTRLRQILINVIGNALKFTDKGGVFVTVLTRSGSEQPALIIKVRDTGIGISQQQAGRLFEAFEQADSSTTRKYGGTGLGLFLSRKLARNLGGDLRLLSSSQGEGSIFEVALPLKAEELVDCVSEIAPPALPVSHGDPFKDKSDVRLDGVHILVVDDTPDNQRLVSRVLAKAGAAVKLADNGLDGVHAGLSEDFDLILMDIQMPGLDGIRAAGQLRKAGFAGPLVAFTAHAMAEERQRCFDAGYDEIITKPFDLTNLMQTVERFTVKGRVSGPIEELDPMIKDIVDDFIKGAFPEVVGALKEALSLADAPEIARNAHILKGSVAVYLDRNLKEVAHDLETEAKGAARRDRMHGLLREIQGIYQKLSNSLRQSEL